jgi:hypothetical protein
MAYLQPPMYGLVVQDIYYGRFICQSQRCYDDVFVWTRELEEGFPSPGIDLQWM